MDQFISANGAEDHALLLDCRDLSFKLAPIPSHVALVIANTMVKHSVAGGEYTSRRAQVEEAAAVIARHRPDVRYLRDATLDDLEQWGAEMSANALKRARHVISENLRTVAAADALLNGNLEELGRLMAEAHRSYSEDFEASCVEADTMVALAQDLPGLIGARLTGGGFGGCTINLVEREHAAEFSEALGARYTSETGIVPQIDDLPCIARGAPGECIDATQRRLRQTSYNQVRQFSCSATKVTFPKGTRARFFCGEFALFLVRIVQSLRR